MFFYFPSQLPIFCLGILLFFMVNEKESLRNISGKSILVFSFLLILQFGAKVQFFPNFIFFGFAFFILSYALSIYQFKLFVNPIINHIGKISFSMYLVHFAILFWLKQYNFLEFSNYGLLNFGVRFTLVTCLTVLLSSFFYYTIELKFQDLGKKIINKLTSTK
jgi:peptidoglycan/LPS O-acetylase OafA/YrhL